MADLPDINAARRAGYQRIVLDRGPFCGDASSQFEVTLEKWLVGAPGASGGMLRAHGHGKDEATAEAQAFAALNEQRAHRYAGTSSIPANSQVPGHNNAPDSFASGGENGTPMIEDVS